jgi:CDP-paratose 2-epimerase
MDARLAETAWGWRPVIKLEAILEEIAKHAEQHPAWLEISAAL